MLVCVFLFFFHHSIAMYLEAWEGNAIIKIKASSLPKKVYLQKLQSTPDFAYFSFPNVHRPACFDLSGPLALYAPNAVWMQRTRPPLSSFVEINWVRARMRWSWLWNLFLGNIKWCFNQLKAALEFLNTENGCSWRKLVYLPQLLTGREEQSNWDAVGKWHRAVFSFLVTY